VLDFVGRTQAAHLIMAAIKALTREGRVLTPDMGGSARTVEVGDELVAQMRAAEKRALDS
jgi:tartrate dehydrogenase/decarboxylase/D-malate dehydrogenase